MNNNLFSQIKKPLKFFISNFRGLFVYSTLEICGSTSDGIKHL